MKLKLVEREEWDRVRVLRKRDNKTERAEQEGGEVEGFTWLSKKRKGATRQSGSAHVDSGARSERVGKRTTWLTRLLERA